MLRLSCAVRKVDQLAYTPDGTLFTAGARATDSINCVIPSLDNRGVQVWRPGGTTPVTHAFPDDQVNGLVPLPDGRVVANLALIRANRGAFGVGWVDPAGASGRFAPEFTHLPALAAGPGLTVAFGNGPSGYRDRKLVGWRGRPFEGDPDWAVPAEPGQRVERAAVTADGRRFVTYETGGGNMLVHQAHWLVERSPADGAEVRRVPLPVRKPAVPVFSPDGHWLAVAAGATAFVWPADALTADPVRLADSGRMAVSGLAFHPHGSWLATASTDGRLRLYGWDTWRLAQTFAFDAGKLRGVAFAPDGLTAAAGSDTGRVVVWDVDL